eukprot:1147171-Pelagomonas_calceolata.AAC.1
MHERSSISITQGRRYPIPMPTVHGDRFKLFLCVGITSGCSCKVAWGSPQVVPVKVHGDHLKLFLPAAPGPGVFTTTTTTPPPSSSSTYLACCSSTFLQGSTA